MLLRASRELDLDLPHSYVVGDSDMDTQMGKAVGCKTILVPESIEAEKGKKRTPEPDFMAHTVYDAAQWILHQLKSEPIMAEEKSSGDIR